VLPALPLHRCPAWGRAMQVFPGVSRFAVTLCFFSSGPASLKSLYFYTDAAFSTPVTHDCGQAADAWQGDLCQLKAGDKGNRGGGHSQSAPITPGVLCLFEVLHEGEAGPCPRCAALLPSIPGSLRVGWESVVPALQHPFRRCRRHRARPVTEPATHVKGSRSEILNG